MPKRDHEAAPRESESPPEHQDGRIDTMTMRAFREITVRIRELDLEPGRAFTENELAEELGMGKTPVREALLVLGAQGFVVPRPRSGYRVSPVTVKDARETLAVLRALSAEAAALAAERGVDAATLLTLSDLDEDFVASSVDAVRDIVIERTRFFGILGAESGNQRLLLIMNQMLNHFARLLHLTLKSGTLRRLPAGQPNVIDALRSGGAREAAEATRRLVDAWERALIKALLQSETVLSVNVAPALRERPTRIDPEPSLGSTTDAKPRKAAASKLNSKAKKARNSATSGSDRAKSAAASAEGKRTRNTPRAGR